MISEESRRKLREMNLDALVVALDNQESNILNYFSMSFDKRLDLAIDECYTSKNADKARRLIRCAKLRYPNADINTLYYENRKIDKEPILILSTCNYIDFARNIIVNGFTGSGKNFPCLCPW